VSEKVWKLFKIRQMLFPNYQTQKIKVLQKILEIIVG
jgi:hypothetical protein